MIVRRHQGHLLLVRQPDHAALAERVMAAWCRDGLPGHEVREAILLATREHDNGWIEEDARPSIDPATGRPYDFIGVPDEVKHAIWPRAVGRLADGRPDVAALIAQHALTVHGPHAGNPRWAPFFDTMERLRNDLLERVRVHRLNEPREPRPQSLADFYSEYRFVYLGDLISLMFCNGWTEPMEAEGYRLVLRGDTLEVAPDPFDGQRVPLDVPARTIPDRVYGSNADFLHELARGQAVSLSGTALGMAGS